MHLGSWFEPKLPLAVEWLLCLHCFTAIATSLYRVVEKELELSASVASFGCIGCSEKYESAQKCVELNRNILRRCGALKANKIDGNFNLSSQKSPCLGQAGS